MISVAAAAGWIVGSTAVSSVAVALGFAGSIIAGLGFFVGFTTARREARTHRWVKAWEED